MRRYRPEAIRYDDPDETEGRRMARIRAERQARADIAYALHPVRLRPEPVSEKETRDG